MYAMECQNAEPTSCATCSQAEMEPCACKCVWYMRMHVCVVYAHARVCGICACMHVCVVCAHACLGARFASLFLPFCVRARVFAVCCSRACVHACVRILCVYVCVHVLACVCVFSPCGSSSGRWAPRCCLRKRPPPPAAGGSGWPRGAAG